MNCPACHTENGPNARFCVECGTPLALACPSCAAPYSPGQKFCAECGAPLAAAADRTAPPAATPAGELRTVSVLFVDLVGYTGLSESRDAEDVRDLLSRYFDTARTIVTRYGGVVEKFIGDAVMAVWGTPQAREDDAERAVRAGLELVDAVAAFGEEVGAPELRARAGVVTGQVSAVTTPGEGIVVGDRVNTASRVQSAAEPGTVLVDDVTRRATAAAIAYADAGEHSVKGKVEPLQLWRAERVVAGVAGVRAEGDLEARFVGRDSELRLIKELWHSGMERRGARLVSVTGPAGVGKSRLRQEFMNYVDGLAAETFWHSGRCLSYGEGVAYFALAEMVRQRLGIPEEEAQEDAARKLVQGLDRWVPDAAEREFLEPRLGALIGTAQPELGRQELFAGWRLFFERLSDHLAVTLVFEDLHWADSGLLDFIDHLLEWSADRPIFVLTFARPELAERRAGWPAGRRGATPLFLEPLSDDAIAALLDDLVIGLPAEARDRIVRQAEGVPLYALETVRALADRDVLVRGDDRRLRVAAEIGDLDMPATLTSLLAARLDVLDPDERELVKAMAVFGGSFPRAAAAALSDLPDDRLDQVLASLVRKQVLAVRADPLSPDRGQYGFAQTLLRTVAYDMLPKRERKPRHLAAAAHLRAAFPNDGEDMAEVIAAHLLDAYKAALGDPDEDELRVQALDALRRAGQRTAAVGAPDAAERAYRSALELADEAERSELALAAAEMALRAEHYEQAIELFGSVAASADGRDSARAIAGTAQALVQTGRLDEAIERLEAAVAAIDGEEFDPQLADLHAELGNALIFAGRSDEAEEPLERALVTAQALDLPQVLVRALGSKAVFYLYQERFDEARGVSGIAADVAERYGLLERRAVALSNRGVAEMQRDLPGAARALTEGLAISRRVGNRALERLGIGNLMLVNVFAGRWDEAEELAAGMIDKQDPSLRGGVDVHERLAILKALRGQSTAEHVAAIQDELEAANVEDRFIALAAARAVALAEGRPEELVENGTEMLREGIRSLGSSNEAIRQAWPDTFDAAMVAGRVDVAAEMVQLLEEQPRGRIAPYLRAELSRARGLLAAAAGDREAERELKAATDAFRDLGYPYFLARAQIDRAAWLADNGRSAEASELLHEAIEALSPLRAMPALARANELLAGLPSAVSA